MSSDQGTYDALKAEDRDHACRIAFFFADAAWIRSRAERLSVSYTKVTKSRGRAITCK